MTVQNQTFLTLDVHGAPRTETLIFATGRGSSAPVDDMRDIATRVLRDGVAMTLETGVGLCNALLELDARLGQTSQQLEIVIAQLAEARGAAQAYGLDLRAARQEVLQTEVLRRAALEDALQHRSLAIRLSDENRLLRLESSASSASSAYLDLQIYVDRDAPDDEQWGEEDSNEDTVVQDTPYGCADVVYGAGRR
jgi:hypothetical protein